MALVCGPPKTAMLSAGFPRLEGILDDCPNDESHEAANTTEKGRIDKPTIAEWAVSWHSKRSDLEKTFGSFIKLNVRFNPKGLIVTSPKKNVLPANNVAVIGHRRRPHLDFRRTERVARPMPSRQCIPKWLSKTKNYNL